ncbi:MAG: SPFH domain-containing protein [Candidatus Margulisiibacteriota bacterium]
MKKIIAARISKQSDLVYDQKLTKNKHKVSDELNATVKFYPCKSAKATGTIIDILMYASVIYSPVAIAKNIFLSIPNEAVILSYNGKPHKIFTKPGLHYASGIGITGDIHYLSTRVNVNEIESDKLQDKDGFLVKGKANISWQVTDPLKAYYILGNVKPQNKNSTGRHNHTNDTLESYIHSQANATLKTFAAKYSLLNKEENNLNNLTPEMQQELNSLLQAKLDLAGIKVHDFDFISLTYVDENKGYLPQFATKIGQANMILQKSDFKKPEILLQSALANNVTVSSGSNEISLAVPNLSKNS